METHRGILPNKRLRFWWAVVGLIALVVPYVTNMGLLAKTVYAAEKTLYKSDRLTVTAGDGDGWQWQNGRDVSWKLNFIDKETKWPNWDKVTFKIDPAAAKKAGLTLRLTVSLGMLRQGNWELSPFMIMMMGTH